MIKKLNERRLKALPTTIAAAAIALSLFVAPMTASAATSQATDAKVEFTAGALSLDSAPALDFGNHTASGQTAEYPATGSLTAIGTSDLRGTSVGWKVNVALQNFKLNGQGSQTLKGSSISVANITVTPKNGTVGTPPALAGSSVTIPSDGTTVKLLSAPANTGDGVFDTDLSASDTKLKVLPGTASTGKHVAVMDWTIENTP